MPVPALMPRRARSLSVEGTVAGRAFATTAIIDVEAPAGEPGRRLWLPLLDGTERARRAGDHVPGSRAPLPERLLAAARALCPSRRDPVRDQEHLQRLFRAFAPAAADDDGQRAAWALVPPLVLAADDFVLAALLEPCYDMGGDAFDYALNAASCTSRSSTRMGHGLPAAGMTAVRALGVPSPPPQRRRARGRLHRHRPRRSFDAVPVPSRFVTALIAELDLDSGRLRWVSAGHPAPLLAARRPPRQDARRRTGPPLGTGLATSCRPRAEESLEPGDMILLYTDGLTRSTPARRRAVHRRAARRVHRARGGERSAAPETLRRLRAAIIERREGALRRRRHRAARGVAPRQRAQPATRNRLTSHGHPPWIHCRRHDSPGGPDRRPDRPRSRAPQHVTTGETAPIRLTTNGDTILATLAGDFDMQATFTSSRARAALQTPGLRRIDLDLRRLQFIDSTRIGVIVGLHAIARRQGIELHLTRTTPSTASSRRPEPPRPSHSPRPTISTPVDVALGGPRVPQSRRPRAADAPALALRRPLDEDGVAVIVTSLAAISVRIFASGLAR